jgi:tripartite-type tricarboxylate transporter receptor subunit TctC
MRWLGLALGVGVMLSTPTLAQADNWPSRTITFVVPYAAGGYTDTVGRIVASYVEKQLGQPVVVETRPGGGGVIGTQFVAGSSADGYTFCVCSSGAISVVPYIQKVSYDPVKDLVPVGLVSSIAQAVIVKKDMPVSNIAEFVEYAKANPGKLNYGSSGMAGLNHYSVQLFQSRTGTKTQHIPFKGGAPATLAVVTGEIDFAFANMTDALPQIEAGTVKGIAVTSKGRVPYLPNIPSIHETFLADFVVESWNGIMAPAGTSDAIVRRLAEVLNKMADDPAIIEIMRKAGSVTVKGTPEGFGAQIQAEAAQWGPLLKGIVGKKG